MTTKLLLAGLWRLLDEGRNSVQTSAEIIQEWLGSLNAEEVTTDLLYALEGRLDKLSQDWAFQTPRRLSEFVAKVTETYEANSVLNPTCGNGALLALVADAVGAEVVHGIDINARALELAAKVLGQRATLIQGDALVPHSGVLDRYDLIVADPPLGLRLNKQQAAPASGENLYRDFGNALAVWATGRLTEHGVAVLTVNPQFFFSSQAEAVHQSIRGLGCRIRGAIHLPGGTLNYTGTAAYLVIIEGGGQGDLFVGQFQDDAEQQDHLLRNLKRGNSGPQPALGRLCSLAAFKGFDAFVAQGRLARLAKKTGWIGRPAGEVLTACQRLGSSRAEALDHGSNSLYLRSVGRIAAAAEIDELVQGHAARMSNVLHLHLAPELVHPRFMTHWFNESRVGQTTLATIGRGSLVGRVSATDLMDLTIHLPPVDEQHRIVEGVAHLRRIRAEADELENALWAGTEDSDDLVQAISTINQEDRYEDWIETLPYPLASILWRHHASKGSRRERYEVLLHFFEATAAFLATVHLSAFMASDELWNEHGRRLSEKLSQNKLSLDQASFGAWKLVSEYLSSACSSLLKDAETVELRERLYGTADDRIFKMLCDSKLRSVLQQANKVRNDWGGHGGAISTENARQVDEQLMDLVQRLRGIFGRLWLRYELIQPGDGRYKGGTHHIKASRLMGTRSAPFKEVVRESAQPLEADALYLFDSMSQTGLQLRPFIQVIPSPERQAIACFILSRYKTEGSRFVSYHFEQESQIAGNFPGLDEAIALLHRFEEAEA